MIRFDMAIADNFARFQDDDSGLMVFVDSFDNTHFEVRIGSLEKSVAVGVVKATTDAELNGQLATLLANHTRG